MNKQFWYPIFTAVIASVILNSLSGLYQSGQYQNKIDRNASEIENLRNTAETIRAEIVVMNNEHVSQHQKIENLERDIGKIDQVVEKLNSMDKKMTEFQVTQQYVRRDIQDFRDLVSRMTKDSKEGIENGE